MTLAELTHYNKFWASLIMALLVVLDQVFGISFPGISQAWVTSLLAVIAPLLVWALPNREVEDGAAHD